MSIFILKSGNIASGSVKLGTVFQNIHWYIEDSIAILTWKSIVDDKKDWADTQDPEVDEDPPKVVLKNGRILHVEPEDVLDDDDCVEEHDQLEAHHVDEVGLEEAQPTDIKRTDDVPHNGC